MPRLWLHHGDRPPRPSDRAARAFVLGFLFVVVTMTTDIRATPSGESYAATAERLALGICPSQDYTLQVTPNRRGTALIGIAAFSLRGTYPCHLSTRLRFAVQPAKDRASKPRGVLPGVVGNPAAIAVNAPLTAGRVVSRGWAWHNWCGAAGRHYTLFAVPNDPAHAAWTPNVSPPKCLVPRVPSTLTRVPPRLSLCSKRHYRVDVLPGEGYRERILGGTIILLRHSLLPCRLRTRLTFAIQQQRAGSWQTLRQIQGNPSPPLTVGAVLARGQPAEYFWAWTNWCGSSGHFRWLVHSGKRTSTHPVPQAPACQSRSSPSTLTMFFNPPYPTPPTCLGKLPQTALGGRAEAANPRCSPPTPPPNTPLGQLAIKSPWLTSKSAPRT